MENQNQVNVAENTNEKVSMKTRVTGWLRRNYGKILAGVGASIAGFLIGCWIAKANSYEPLPDEETVDDDEDETTENSNDEEA